MEKFIALLRVKINLVAIFELGLETTLGDSGFELTGDGCDVVKAGTPRELAYGVKALWPGTVLRSRVGSAKIVAAHEADFRIEIVADEEMVELERIEVAVVGKGGLVAFIVTHESRGLRLGVVPGEIDVVVERERGVEAVHLIAPRSFRGRGAASKDATDAAPAENVSFDAHHRKVGGRCRTAEGIVSLNI